MGYMYRIGFIYHGRDVVIFRLHPPHTIQNSLQTLCVLSHSRIAYQMAQAQYHDVSSKL